MDLAKLLEKIDSIEGSATLMEAKKTATTWTDKSGKKHPATKVEGGKYSGEEAEKEEKKKKKVKESSMYDLIRSLDSIAESEQVEEEKVDEDDVEEGNEFSGELAKAKAAGKKEFEVDGKTYPVKESESKRLPAKEKEKSWTDKSGKEHSAKQVQGWQSRRADKEAEDETAKTMKESAQLDECGIVAGDSSMSDSGMSINTNIDTRSGRKSVSVTADGDAADQLMQMLKLAGLSGSGEEQGHEETAVVSVPLAQADGGYGMKEEYSNEPNPQTQGVDVQLRQGTDLNKEKTMHKHSYRQGDNPMAMREAAELKKLEQEIMEEMSTIKVVKKA